MCSKCKSSTSRHFAYPMILVLPNQSAATLLATMAIFLLELNPNFQEIGYGLLGCAAGTVLYSTFVYTRRVRLLRTGQPYGYIDYFGPLVLSSFLFLGIVQFQID